MDRENREIRTAKVEKLDRESSVKVLNIFKP